MYIKYTHLPYPFVSIITRPMCLSVVTVKYCDIHIIAIFMYVKYDILSSFNQFINLTFDDATHIQTF